MKVASESADVEGIEEILITPELQTRPTRSPDYCAESKAIAKLVRDLEDNPAEILRAFATQALRLCRADSSGVSILEHGGAEGVFRWHAVAGEFAPDVNETLPRKSCPCGYVTERDRVILVDRPQRFYPALRKIKPPLREALLAPFRVGGKPIGTAWVITHNSDRHFDAEDARVLESLTRFAAASYHLLQRSQSSAEDARVSKKHRRANGVVAEDDGRASRASLPIKARNTASSSSSNSLRVRSIFGSS